MVGYEAVIGVSVSGSVGPIRDRVTESVSLLPGAIHIGALGEG